MEKEQGPQRAEKKMENGEFVSIVPIEGRVLRFRDAGAKPPRQTISARVLSQLSRENRRLLDLQQQSREQVLERARSFLRGI